MNQSPVGNQQSRHRARAADFELDLAKFESSQATMPYHSCMQYVSVNPVDEAISQNMAVNHRPGFKI
jgi:hypothetical protein